MKMNIKEEIPEEEIYPDSLNPFADDLDPPNKENEQIENFLDDNCNDNTNNSYPDDFNPFQEEPKIGKIPIVCLDLGAGQTQFKIL